jgi:hypothetical protein
MQVPHTSNPWLWAAGAALLGSLAIDASAASDSTLTIKQEAGAVIVRSSNGRAILQYQLQRPAQSKLAVESGCYFHPVATPKGVVLTEEAPADHPHHRGIFLGWVEMHGTKDADFWGWGQPAPTGRRRIVNKKVADLEAGPGQASFRAENEWIAEDEVLIREILETKLSALANAYVIDLTYTLTPRADIKLARWAFSGFCVRLRRDGQLEALGPDGPVQLPNPKHTEPQSDWPSAPCYDFTLQLNNNRSAGVAVLDHPKNPKALWHNHRDVRMLNPCIVAPGEVTLKANSPLVLRYQVVAHDGPVPRDLLNRLHRSQSRSPN